jgi:hypothetical protein
MKDVSSLLRDGDPIAREGELSLADSERMRRRVESAVAAAPPEGQRFFSAVAVTLLLLCAGAVWVTSRSLAPQPAHEQRPEQVIDAPKPVGTHLQFVTPGGTRVFWTFHPKQEAR